MVDSLSRRELLSGLAASGVVSTIHAEGNAGLAAPDGEETQGLYDLLIRGGKVVDPSQNIEALQDVAIRAGKIVRLEPNIPATSALQVLSVQGKIVAPGLIDLHTHVFPHVCPYGVAPDPFCVTRGVTTVVDAGSAGAFGFPAFRRFIETDGAATRIFALLNLSAIGNVSGPIPNMGELEELRFIDSKLALQVAEAKKGLILGFKVRCSESVTGPNDVEVMKRVRFAGDEARLPVTMHIGGSFSPLPDLLAFLKKGDVLTQPYNGRPHGVLRPNGKLLPEVLEARERGVLFDVGHGGGNFSFDVAARCVEDGFPPDSISSDLGVINVHGSGLRFAHHSIEVSVARNEPTRRHCMRDAKRRAYVQLGIEIGTLKPGSEADVAILELRDGQYSFTDSDNKTRTGRQRLVPVATVRGGKVVYPEYPVS